MTRYSRAFLPSLLLMCLMALGAGCEKQERSDADEAEEQRTPRTVVHEDQVQGTVTLIGSDDFGGIQVYIPGTSHASFTDSEGRYRLSGLRPGEHVVMAQYPGYEQVQVGTVEVTAEGEPAVHEMDTMALEPRGWGTSRNAGGGESPEGAADGNGIALQGRVYDVEVGPDGAQPDLSGARVELGGTRMRTVTDPDGSFYLWNVPPGEYSLQIQRPGYAPVRTELELTTESLPLRVGLRPSTRPEAEPASAGNRRISGILEIYDAAGMPVNDYEDVSVVIRELPNRAVDVDESGTFVVGGLEPRTYTLDAFGGAYEMPEPATVDLRNQATAEVVLTLREGGMAAGEAPGAIEGVVVSAEDEAGLSGVQIGLAGTSLSALSDAQGRFALEQVPPGDYELIARLEGYDPARVEDVAVEPGRRIELPEIVLEPDLEYPEVLATRPVDGADEVIIGYVVPIEVRFNKPMNAASVKAALSFEPPVRYRAFMGNEHPRADAALLYIEIDGSSGETPMRFDQAYRMRIGTTAEDLEGLSLREPFVLNFRTSEPAVVGTLPGDGAEGALLDPGRPVVIQFNATLTDDVTADDIRIRPSLPMIPEILVRDQPDTGWSEVHIKGNWREDTVYTVTIPRRIRTFGGQSFANTPYTFQFRTAELLPFEPVVRPVR